MAHGNTGRKRPDLTLYNKVKDKTGDTLTTDQMLTKAQETIDKLEQQVATLTAALQAANLPIPEGMTPQKYLKILQVLFTEKRLIALLSNAFDKLSTTNNAIALEKILTNSLNDMKGDMKDIPRDNDEPKTANIIVFGEYTGCDES